MRGWERARSGREEVDIGWGMAVRGPGAAKELAEAVLGVERAPLSHTAPTAPSRTGLGPGLAGSITARDVY